MKHVLILLFLIAASECRGQRDIINQSLTDSSLGFLYIGVDNQIKVTGITGNYSMAITGGGGTILKTGENQYVVRVASVTDLCQLTLLKGTKNIFHKSYNVRTIPLPVATAGGLKDTTVKATVLLANPFISILFPGCYFRLNFSTLSFQAKFIQGTDSTLTYATGPFFLEEQIKLVKQLGAGDKIFFDEIRALGPDSRNNKLQPFWIKIL